MSSFFVGTLYGRAQQTLRMLRYRGDRVFCPCCGGRFCVFLPFGVPPQPKRPNALCPSCGALERHRLLWLYLRRETDLLRRPMKLLHLAPEPALQRHLEALRSVRYVPVDLAAPDIQVRVDATRLGFGDASFDAILGSHVLEHIADDRAAMRELLRVLKPGAWAILQSPLDSSRESTFEDPSVVTPDERTRVFGQHDHVRIYGRDYQQRLEEAGFMVTPDDYGQRLGRDSTARYGLMPGEVVWLCRKLC